MGDLAGKFEFTSPYAVGESIARKKSDLEKVSGRRGRRPFFEILSASSFFPCNYSTPAAPSFWYESTVLKIRLVPMRAGIGWFVERKKG